jgi:hypothetical protein
MVDKIDFEIIKIIDDGGNRFSVHIKYVDPVDGVETNRSFGFKREDQINDAFMDKIKESLDNLYNTDVKVTADRFVGKTFTHEFRR